MNSITGQNGVYLTELLLNNGCIVYGTFRRTSSVNRWRIEELGISKHPNLHLVEYDLIDRSASVRLLQSTDSTEVYNLAAQSFVGVSFAQPITTAEITGIGTVICSKQSTSSIHSSAFAKLAPQKCLARFRWFRKMKTRHSVHAALMA
jgi:GDP-D-mannose dehydratase